MANVSSSNGLEKRPKLRFPGFDEPWTDVHLFDVVDLRRKRARSVKEVYVSTENLLQDFEGVTPYQSDDEVEGIAFNTGDTLLANIRPYLKKAWYAAFDGTCSADVLAFSPKRISPAFLYNIIARDCFIEYVMSGVKGSKMPRGDKTHILEYEFAIPEKDEQEKIATFIALADCKIAKQRKMIAALKKYKRGVQKLFSEMDMKQWELVRLKDVVNIFDGTHQTPNYKTTGVRFISVENILNPLATQKYISEDDYKKEFKVHPEYGDVLMTRIGDIGRTCYVNFDSDIAYYVSLALFKCSSKIDGRFLAAYISTNTFQKELWERTLHIAFPKKINTGEIGECHIRLPSRERQIVIASYLDVIEKKIQLAEKQLNLMQLIKIGLMQQLFI